MDNIIRYMHFNGKNQYEVVHIGCINDLQSCTLQVMVMNLAYTLLRLKSLTEADYQISHATKTRTNTITLRIRLAQQ